MLGFALFLLDLDRRRDGGGSLFEALGQPHGPWAWTRLALPALALAGGIFFSYSFAGLAWPLAIAALWSLTARRRCAGRCARGRCCAPCCGRRS